MKRRIAHRFWLPNPPYFGGDLNNKSQFEASPLCQDEQLILKPHFMISKKNTNEAGWVALRVKIHKLAAYFHEHGVEPLRYTKAILDKDIDMVLSDDLDKYQFSPIRFGIRSNNKVYGRRVIAHFETPDDTAVSTCDSPRALVRAITAITKSRKPLTRENITRRISSSGFINPNFYRSWFRGRLDIAGSNVIDMTPNGSRALAVILDGGHYLPYEYDDMSRFVGVEPVRQVTHRDIAFVNGLTPVSDMKHMRHMMHMAKNVADVLVVCSGRELMSEMISLYSPKYTLRISVRPHYGATIDDYIFIIDQR